MIHIRHETRAETVEKLKRAKKKRKHKSYSQAFKEVHKQKKERFNIILSQINSLPKRKHYLQYQTYYSSPQNKPIYYEDYGFEDQYCMIDYEEFNWFILKWMINAGGIRTRINKLIKEDKLKQEIEQDKINHIRWLKAQETAKRNREKLMTMLVNTLKTIENKKITEKISEK